jgi:hypothetical protein
MTTIDELRRSFEELAAAASDGAGMAERATAGAARVRRRRAVGAAAAALCLVAVVTAVVPLVVNRQRADGPPPASVVVVPYRGPGQLTVRPAPDSGRKWSIGSDGFLQFMTPSFGTMKNCCAEVRVYDPGAYDSRALEGGEKITVAGHPGYRATIEVPDADPVPRMPAGPPGRERPDGTARVLTVGWQDPSGPWVTVLDIGSEAGLGLATSPDPLSLLLDVAADIRLGAPRDVLVPMHFPAVPGNLPITFADVDDISVADGGQLAVLGFGGDPRPSVELFHPSQAEVDTPLTIKAWTANGQAPWTEMAGGPVNTTVAGRPARYYERSGKGGVRVPAGGSVLLVEIGSCGIQINVGDRKAITRADLETMFSGATFDECDSIRTWTRPFN